jgi:hypothetical protein
MRSLPVSYRRRVLRRNDMSGDNRGSTRRETVNAAVLSCRGRVITNDRRVPGRLVRDHFGFKLGFKPCGTVEHSFSPDSFLIDKKAMALGIACPACAKWPIATTRYAPLCCNLKYQEINNLHSFKQTFGIIAKVPKAIKFRKSRR